jgi:leucyl-tRNA synthetase
VFERVRAALAAPAAAAPAGVAGDAAVALRRKTHRTIQRVTDDIDKRMHFNTAVSAIMELTNACAECAGPEDGPADLDADRGQALREAFHVLARLLAPFAPHFAEELWETLGGSGFVSVAAWPVAEAALLREDHVTIVVQVSGKVRGQLALPRGVSQDDALAAARQLERVAAQLDGKTVRRVVWVPDKLLNVVAT